MQKKIPIFTALVALVCGVAFCSGSIADQHEAVVITSDKVNLTGAEFLPEFISKSPDRRTAARLYLLGVLDSSEGRVWCGYSQLKTVTINEFVYEYLKKQSPEKLKSRASALIEEALHSSFPCKDTK